MYNASQILLQRHAFSSVRNWHISFAVMNLGDAVGQHFWTLHAGMQGQGQTLRRHLPITREMSGCLMAVTSHANRSTRSVFFSQSRFCCCWYLNYSFFSSSALYHKKIPMPISLWKNRFFVFWFSGLWDFFLDFWRYLGIEKS